MKVGFTGTRGGLTEYQRQIACWLLENFKLAEFHHGDCFGADADAHDLVRKYQPDCTIVLHPPTKSDQRANCKADIVRKPKPFLKRNHDIVKETDFLVAIPKENKRVKKGTRGSGTWATIYYAEDNAEKPVYIIWPGVRNRMSK